MNWLTVCMALIIRKDNIMVINGKKVTIGTLATVIPIVMFYFYISDRGILPLSESAHAQDVGGLECRLANLEWSRANENLRFAVADLKSFPSNISNIRAVDNYERQKKEAQRKIDVYCK